MVYENCFICNEHNILNLLSYVTEKVCGKCVEVFVFICNGNGLYVMEIIYANCLTCNGNIILGFQDVMEIMGFRV